MRNILLLLGIAVLSASTFAQQVTQGSLFAYGADGTAIDSVPLKHTAVKAEISGFLARVRVTQEFENTFAIPIEAIYTFPLSQNSAVDEMTMTIGERVIRGTIMKREEAREVYEEARSSGKRAALLDQQRPNIFTQAVANIMPGEKILIEISYVETLKYEDGSYEFVFPMTVGPRYIPGSVADAAKISPPIAEARAGHDISVEVNINAGVPIEAIRSTLHKIEQVNINPSNAKVTLAESAVIPNRDLIIEYDVTGKRIEDAVIAHRGENGGFFTMILQPPDKIAIEDRTPKEIVFVLDTSGSMSGFPIEKAKEAMQMSLDGLYPEDMFNLITFAGDTHILFDEPVPATRANLDAAKQFLASRTGGGGTEMMKAVSAALKPSASQTHLRIVCFMTDGFIGNEKDIIAEIMKYSNARVFSFGIGDSVNRYLLDKMAEAGRGDVEYVTLEDKGSEAAKRFYERVRTPILTNISIDWNGLPVADVYPKTIPDLFSAKPVVIHGRYSHGTKGVIKLRGTIAGSPYVREIAIDLPEQEPRNDSLASLWARTRIDDLTNSVLKEGTASDTERADANNLITQIGLEFSLLTEFTSFVAVEEQPVNYNGDPKTIEVPVELPEGSAAADSPFRRLQVMTALSRPAQANYRATGSGSGGGGGGIPQGTNFTSTLSVKPGVRPENKSGGFAIDGSSGSETSFTIDGQEVVNFRNGGLNSTPTVKGRTKNLPLPEFTAAAKAANANGVVRVRVLIDESGNVIVAKTLSGHQLLRPASEAAALASKFEPVKIGDKAVRVRGILSYKFGKTKVEGVKVEDMTTMRTAAEKRAYLRGKKFHVWLYAVMERLSANIAEPTPNESTFVSGGKAAVEVTLSANNSAVIGRLRAVGFETQETNGNTLIGKIPIDRLAELADIDEVQLVIPHLR